MFTKRMKGSLVAAAGVAALSANLVFAQGEAAPAAAAEEPPADSLEQLLDFVKQGQVTEGKENRAREQRFARDKANQAQALKDAEAERTRQEQRSEQLEKEFADNELLITAKKQQLREKLGTLTELFGHLTSASGDLASNIEVSLASSQYPDRGVFLQELIDKMSGADTLPSIEEIEKVWFELLREVRETGVVTTYSAEVSTPAGEREQREVLRVGAFNIVDMDGNYLSYENGKLAELPRQPSGGNYNAWAADLANASSGLNTLRHRPDRPDRRLLPGGDYRYAHTGRALAPGRLCRLRHYRRGYLCLPPRHLPLPCADGCWRQGEFAAEEPRQGERQQPAGPRAEDSRRQPEHGSETLELKLSEGVLRETPKLESGLTLLKIIAAVAPLMGLLGTVTGMIITFQAITIFGAGDPKAMAGGISGALITTVLGLLVAIPTVLLHTVVNGRAQRIIHILDEQTTGIIAEHTEANLRS